MTFDPEHYREVANWTSEQLDALPNAESDRIEYKSSQASTHLINLGEKISVAASAFWNTGGGLLVLGIDPESGVPDGGMPSTVGRQTVRDWVDQHIARTEPLGLYAIGRVEGSDTTENIENGNLVVLIGFGESTHPPHMASDYRYYVRTGAHSVPVGHHVAMALRSQARPSMSVAHRWELSAGTRRLTVELYVKNEGGALARFPCLTIKQPENWVPNPAYSNLSSAALPRRQAPSGWWKRAAGTADHVLYPGDEVYVGQVGCDIPESLPSFRMEYSVTAEGIESTRGEISISDQRIVEALVAQERVSRE
jgi:hypothetical protein